MQKDIIAFWGYPRKELINEYKTKYPSATWIDLDIDASFLADQFYLDGNIKDPYDNKNSIDLEVVKITIELYDDYTVDDITVNGLPNNCKKYG